MKNNLGPSRKGKGAAVGLVICFVAVIALVGAVTFSRYERNNRKERLAQLAETTDTKEKQEEKKDDEDTQAANSQAVENEEKEKEQEKKQPEQEQPEVQTAARPDALAFSENDLLAWPVDGNVMLNYSMDKTVYFATLDQYKYNPAVIISGEVGNEVTASARGIVKSVEVNAQTGTTVTMELGNGYEAVYGQLKEVPVQEGAYVEKGGIVGYLSEPTKYYSVEGCNLYFQLLKEGQPVNPMEYMDSE